jgi:hypothetical protein
MAWHGGAGQVGSENSMVMFCNLVEVVNWSWLDRITARVCLRACVRACRHGHCVGTCMASPHWGAGARGEFRMGSWRQGVSEVGAVYHAAKRPSVVPVVPSRLRMPSSGQVQKRRHSRQDRCRLRVLDAVL